MNHAFSRASDDRIAALERRLRWQVRTTGAVFVLVVTAFVLGAGPGAFEEIKARRFIVSDDQDKPRALLTSHQGTTVLSLFDSEGTARARFSVMDDGHPEITLLDEAGQTRIRLAEREGAVLLQIEDGHGHGKIVLGQNEKQFGINVSSSGDESGVRLRAHPDQPQIAILGPDGSGAVQAFAHGNKSGISVSGSNGQPGAILTLLDNMRPMLLLQGQQKRTLVVPQEPIATQSGNTVEGNSPTRQ